MAKRFEELEAWQHARRLTNEIYRVSALGRFSRDFGLRDQVRRAGVSVMSNIAEGFERGGNKEFMQFLCVAKASCGEARSELCVASDQGYITLDQFEALSAMALQTSRLISGLLRYLRQSSFRGSKFSDLEP